MPVALPDLGALAAALFLLLIAAALWVLIQLLVNSIGKAPVIGSWIVTNVGGWLNDARNAILAAQSASWHAFIQLLKWTIDLLVIWPAKLALALWNLAQGLERTVFVRLPLLAQQLYGETVQALDTAETYALSLGNRLALSVTAALGSLENWTQARVDALALEATHLFNVAEQDVTAALARAEADAANLVTQASTALQADIASAEALAAHEVSALQASVQAAVNQLAADMAHGLASAEALAYSQVQALQGAIVTDLETIGDSAIGLAWPDAVPDLQALRGVLGADFPWLNDLLGLLAGAGTAGLLGALIRSMATSQALTRLATDCIIPNCRNLSGLGNDLQNLLSVASDAALLAWLVQLVHNPDSWAQDMVTEATPLGNAAMAAGRLLFGVS
jgi:hypothetical protein